MTKTTAFIGKSTLYARNEDLKLRIGSKGKVVDAANVIFSLPKGERRKLRKTLRGEGFGGIASIKKAA